MKKIMFLCSILIILVACNNKNYSDSNVTKIEENSNKVISLEKDLDDPTNPSKNYINFFDESVNSTNDLEYGYEFYINIDKNKDILIKNLKQSISVEIENPNGLVYNNLKQENNDEYYFDEVSDSGLYKVKINTLNSKKIKLDLYVIEK